MTVISYAAFSSSDSPAPEASALSQEENPRNQLMALMLLTAQPHHSHLHSLILQGLGGPEALTAAIAFGR